MSTSLAKDARGTSVQVLAVGTTQTVAVGSESLQSTTITGSNVVRIISTSDCHIVVSANPTATTTSMFIPGNVPEYIEIENTTDKIAVIQNSEAGTLFITEMV